MSKCRTIARFSPTLVDRFWSKVNQGGPDDCWPWVGCSTPDGYGRIIVGQTSDGKYASLSASRTAWILANGQQPGDLVVRHRCDNPPCCNPAHLEVGTQADNNRDMHERGRAVQVRGERIAQSKLTEDQVREIVEMRNSGATLAVIAARYGASIPAVHAILVGATWSHITGLPRTRRLPRVSWQTADHKGEKNNSAKLTEDDVRSIFTLRSEGRTQRDIAEVYGIGQTAVSRILTGKRWPHMSIESNCPA